MSDKNNFEGVAIIPAATAKCMVANKQQEIYNTVVKPYGVSWRKELDIHITVAARRGETSVKVPLIATAEDFVPHPEEFGTLLKAIVETLNSIGYEVEFTPAEKSDHKPDQEIEVTVLKVSW